MRSAAVPTSPDVANCVEPEGLPNAATVPEQPDVRPWCKDVRFRYVCYTGVSPLPQIAWPCPWSGPVLVVSLHDGVAALLISLLILGVVFSAIVVEPAQALASAVK